MSKCKGSVQIILQTLSENHKSPVVNLIDGLGQSVLSYAWNPKVRDHLEPLDILVDFHAFDLRLAIYKDKSGTCPLVWKAQEASEAYMQKRSMRWGRLSYENTPGRGARFEGCWKLIKTLSARLDSEVLSNHIIQFGEDSNKKNILGHFCQMHQPECLHLLLRSCPPLLSQLPVPDGTGTTPLIHASRHASSHETATFLLETAEMDYGYRDRRGRTALSYIAENLGQFSDGGLAARLVDQYGQDALETDDSGWSPLHYAISNGHVWESSPYYRLLEDSNAPVDWKDVEGRTILHWAIIGGSPDAI